MHFSNACVIWLTFYFRDVIRITNIKMAHLYYQKREKKNKVLLCFLFASISKFCFLEEYLMAIQLTYPWKCWWNRY